MKRRPLTRLQALPLLTAALLSVVQLATSKPARGSPVATSRLDSENFTLEVPRSRERLGRAILELAEAANRLVASEMPRPIGERIALVWCPTERDFYGRLRGRKRHLLAVALPARLSILLNGEQLERLDRGRFHQALSHELVHIYLGRLLPREIPLWLNEGLAMHVARQWRMADAAALAVDSLFGTLIPARRLTDSFPDDPSSQHRAYRQSYSMTAFLLYQRYPQSGVRGLVADLAADDQRLLSLLSDPKWLDSFEQRWRHTWLRSGRIGLILTSSGLLWLVLALLCVYAYARKRRARKQREARWAFEQEFGYYDDVFDD